MFFHHLAVALVLQAAPCHFRSNADILLLRASDQSNFKVVEHALRLGANVNTTEENGWTPLMLAVKRQNMTIVRLLISHGSNVNSRSKLYEDYSPMILAVLQNNVPIARILLRHGADINDLQHNDLTLLILAIGNGNVPVSRQLKMVKFLVNHGADIEKKGYAGQTVLDYAKTELIRDPQFAPIVTYLEKQMDIEKIMREKAAKSVRT